MSTLQTNETTIGTINHDELCFYIESLRVNGIIDYNDDYELIAECVYGNFDIIVEYEDIKEYYEFEQLDLEDKDVKLTYRNVLE